MCDLGVSVAYKAGTKFVVALLYLGLSVCMPLSWATCAHKIVVDPGGGEVNSPLTFRII